MCDFFNNKMSEQKIYQNPSYSKCSILISLFFLIHITNKIVFFFIYNSKAKIIF